MYFKLFWLRTRLLKVFESAEKFFHLWIPEFTSAVLPVISLMF